MRRLTLRHLRSAFPRRKKSAHKGDVGRLLIIAGSRGMSGAGVLSSMGAMRMGAGLVRLVTVKSQQPMMARRAPLEVMTTGLPETKEGTFSKAAWPALSKILRSFKPNVLAIGPGLGASTVTRHFVHSVLSKTSIPLVLDADGLRALQRKRKAPLIITPHPGEMARLFGVTAKEVQHHRQTYAVRAAKKFGCVCVLKGDGTLVTDGRTLWKNTTGNAGMASGGTGDVLTGMMASLWGQMNSSSALLSAALGVYLHGLAGDLAAKKMTMHAMLASDLVQFMPQAIRRLRTK